MTDRTDGTPERAPRCLRLVANKRGVNRCTNERADGSSLCVHHLAQAVEDYRQIMMTHVPVDEPGKRR